MNNTSQHFESYFSDKNIVSSLCKIRLKKALNKHDSLFLDEIAVVHKSDHPLDKETLKLYRMLPKRRHWRRYRPRNRCGIKDGKVSYYSLLNCTLVQLNEGRLSELSAFIDEIKGVVFSKRRYEFTDYSVNFILKSGHEYRAVSTFSKLEDRVVDSIVAKYLREKLDIAFEDCCIAFRKNTGRNCAIEKLIEYRQSFSESLFVAECDIKKFYDTVGHEVALDTFEECSRIAAIRDPLFELDHRSIDIFKSFLRSFSFPTNILKDTKFLKRKTKDFKAVVPWCEDELREYYESPLNEKVGVPQGTALSCFVSNIVLSRADREVLLRHSGTDGGYLYFRYCDDILLAGVERSVIDRMFDAYQKSLKSLKLAIHNPVSLDNENDYWTSKSKSVFMWDRSKGSGSSEWIKFLGYDIRFDGVTRITRSSVRKHMYRLRSLSIQTIDSVRKNNRSRSITSVLSRLEGKMVALSVGKKNLKAGSSLSSEYCWSNGFYCLKIGDSETSELRELDRYRSKCLRWVNANLKSSDVTYLSLKNKLNDTQKGKGTEFWGRPYSYERQFPRFESGDWQI